VVIFEVNVRQHGRPAVDTQGKAAKPVRDGGILNNPHLSVQRSRCCVADNDQPKRDAHDGIGAGPTSNPVRVLPHIHLEDHQEPRRRVTMQDDCNLYKGKADALVFMRDGGSTAQGRAVKRDRESRSRSSAPSAA